MLRHLRNDERFQACMRFVVDYLRNSNIHGLKQLARTDMHFTGFIFWLLVLVITFDGQARISVLLQEFYNNKNVGIDSDVNYVSFVSTVPSFTFCNEPRLDVKRLEEFFSAQLKNSSETFGVLKRKLRTKKFLNILINSTIASTLEYPIYNYNYSTNDYMQMIFNLSEKHNVTMNGIQSQKIMTDLGICHSFNNQLVDAVGTRHFGDVVAPLSEQQLPAMQHFDFYDKYPIKFEFSHNFTTAAKLFVHHPFEIPTSWSKPFVSFEPMKKLKLSFTLNEIVLFKDYASVTKIENRRCRTHSESNLAMFPGIYSRNLCLMNCRAQHAIRVCGCVPHFYAKAQLLSANPRSTICSPIGLNCLSHYGYIMQNLLGEELLDDGNFNKHDFKCSCLPNCADMATKLWGEITPTTDDTFDLLVTIDSPPDVQFRRRVLFTESDFIVSLGSAFSLILGCSVLNFVDFIYYFSLRLFWFRRGYSGNTKLQHRIRKI